MSDPRWDEALAANQRRWDEFVHHHVQSAHYDVRGFLEGADTLTPLELAELGPVDGLSLLHLQCHFGLDTLCWARRGARVTGVDFSTQGLRVARMLAERTGVPARFVESEVTRAHETLAGERFDRVVTTWGVLAWIPDLGPWAQAIHALLVPGGSFHLVEIHPLVWMFDQEQQDGPRTFVHPYFARGRATTVESGGSYAAPEADLVNTTEHFWSYELGGVVTALARAGLVIEHLQEHDAVNARILPEMVQGEDGLWRMPEGPSFPLSFTIRARRPG